MVIPKEDLISKIKPYKKHMVSAAQWNNFRKENIELELPHANTLINRFGSWNKVKEVVEDLPVQKQWELTELIELLENHIDGLQGTPKDWEDYKLQHSTETLPSSATIIMKFDSWNNVKRTFNLVEKSNNRPRKYTDDQLVSLVKDHIPYSLSQRSWIQYKKGKDLPSYQTFLNRIKKQLNEIQESHKK